MLPNFIWFAVPAPDDILRGDSANEVLDVFVTVFQVIMIFLLCCLKNVKAKKPKFSPLIIASLLSLIFYYLFWVLYYCKINGLSVIIGLCVLPSLCFIFFAIDRKNYFALCPAVIFMILHTMSSVLNVI